MPKLTETFNDRAKAASANNGSVLHMAPPRRGRPPKPQLVEPHEPTRSNPDFIPPNIKTVMLTQAGPWTPPSETEWFPPAAPAPQVQELKVALIGTAPSSRNLAPFNDPTWQIWGCSPGNMNVLPRVDVWFELHGNLLWPENKSYGEPYIEWLKRLAIPVYMQDQRYVPNALTFPMQDMVKEYGADFFTSSFTWMMAFAIHKGAKEIALYGIDMASRDEYILQRPGFFYFRHLARMKGIKVTAPHESDIMQGPGLYGYSDVTPMGRKILAREQELKQRREQMQGELSKLQQSIVYLDGALEDVDYFKSIWIGQGSATPPEGGLANG